jgi:hypothetical protein
VQWRRPLPEFPPSGQSRPRRPRSVSLRPLPICLGHHNLAHCDKGAGTFCILRTHPVARFGIWLGHLDCHARHFHGKVIALCGRDLHSGRDVWMDVVVFPSP